MPEANVACPHCQKPIRVLTEHAGNQVACPFCHQALTVPHFSKPPENATAEKRSVAKDKRASIAPSKLSTGKVISENVAPDVRGNCSPNQAQPSVTGNAATGSQPILVADKTGRRSLDVSRNLPPKFTGLLPRMADLALSPDGKAVASMSFQEPVKTIMVNGQERVLRRLTPDEKKVRRRQRNAVLFVFGTIFLLVIGALLAQR